MYEKWGKHPYSSIDHKPHVLIREVLDVFPELILRTENSRVIKYTEHEPNMIRELLSAIACGYEREEYIYKQRGDRLMFRNCSDLE